MKQDRTLLLGAIVATAIITGFTVFMLTQAPQDTIYPTERFENFTIYHLPINSDTLDHIYLIYSPYNNMYSVYLNVTDAKDDIIHQENEWSIRFGYSSVWSNYP